MIDVGAIREQMESHGMTPGAVALYLSKNGPRVTEREFRGILEGRITPSWDHLVMIAHLFGVSVLSLIKRE